MEAADSSERLVTTYMNTRCRNTDDHNLKYVYTSTDTCFVVFNYNKTDEY
jgi:hypothetical protein